VALLPEDAVEELLRLYGEEELALVRPLIGSTTLRAAARLIVDAQAGVASIFIPHYWAVYYHDGRAGFSAAGGRVLVFFADPDDDPRLEGGYPERATEIRRLTRDEFYDGLAENERRKADGEGPFMFVVPSVGPAPAHPFFDQLQVGAVERMDQLAFFALDSFVQENLDEEGPQKATARVRL
jgi:hypothetical protein